MKYKDYYAQLGVPRDASLDLIKKAYRKLARQHHPDVSKVPDSEEKFKAAAEAYATLKNPEKRAAYDELGSRPEGEDFSPPPQWSGSSGAQGPRFEDIDLADLLAAMGRGHGSPVSAHGRDYETSASIQVEDAYTGTTLKLDLEDAGGGRVLEVTIPPGIRDGQKLRLRGKGGKGRNGGADGDIYLHITLLPHPVFRVDRHDLYFDLALTPWEAALGAELEVPTLDGPVMLTVPPGTRSGRKLRLRERGMPDGKGGRGDLYAGIQIDVPAVLTERERDLFKQLAQASQFNPRKLETKETFHGTKAV